MCSPSVISAFSCVVFILYMLCVGRLPFALHWFLNVCHILGHCTKSERHVTSVQFQCIGRAMWMKRTAGLYLLADVWLMATVAMGWREAQGSETATILGYEGRPFFVMLAVARAYVKSARATVACSWSLIRAVLTVACYAACTWTQPPFGKQTAKINRCGMHSIQTDKRRIP